MRRVLKYLALLFLLSLGAFGYVYWNKMTQLSDLQKNAPISPLVKADEPLDDVKKLYQSVVHNAVIDIRP